MKDYLNSLNETEKEALNIYNSPLGVLINNLDDYNLGKKLYNECEKNHLPFKCISFESYISFIESLEEVKSTILEINPYETEKDINVFRFSPDIDEGIIDVYKSIDDASKKSDSNNTLYQIKLPKGSKIIPFENSILLKSDDYDLSESFETNTKLGNGDVCIKMVDAKSLNNSKSL